MVYLGERIKRLEDERFLRGAATFLDDIRLPGMLHLAFVRSPYPHARIRAIDTTAATHAPGVVHIETGQSLAMWTHPLPEPGDIPSERRFHRYPLAVDRVRFVGDPVAVVVAETAAAAIDAAEQVEVEYDLLPAVVDPEASCQPDAPRLFDDWPDNVAFVWERTTGDIEDAFAQADHIVSLDLVNQRIYAAFMEPRGAAATVDPLRHELTVWASSQVPHTLRGAIAAALGLPEYEVRVVLPDIGGAFGSKGGVYPEYVLVAALAWKLRRPIKWVETRRESLLTTNQARDQHQHIRAAFQRDGTLRGLDIVLLADLGAYNATTTVVRTALLSAGPYRVPAHRVRAIGVVTNKTPLGAYRGAGRPEAAYLLERLMDQAAAELGIDPASLRLRNLLHPNDFPYRSPTGAEYDSGDYPQVFRRALELFDYEGTRAAQQAARARGELLGIGIACYCEFAGPGWETATVRVHPDGSVTVLSGIAPSGQGHSTMLAQVVGEVLGLPLERIRVRTGDTAAIPQGIGTFGSRSTAVGGSAAYLAAQTVREKARRIAAALLEADPEDVTLQDGQFLVRGAPDRAVSWSVVARAAYRFDGAPGEHEVGLEATHFFVPDGRTVPFGTHLALVRVEPQTGEVTVLRYVAVDDCGRVINPLLVEGQLHGAVAQGIGQALYEMVVYSESGQPLTQTFLDYGIPHAHQVPNVETAHVEIPSPVNPLGAKGVGEAGTTAAPPAIVTAVLDALRPLGVQHLDMPLTPERIWRALVAAQRHAQAC